MTLSAFMDLSSLPEEHDRALQMLCLWWYSGLSIQTSESHQIGRKRRCPCCSFYCVSARDNRALSDRGRLFQNHVSTFLVQQCVSSYNVWADERKFVKLCYKSYFIYFFSLQRTLRYGHHCIPLCWSRQA